MANITPSGYAGLITRIITVNSPIKNPYTHFDVLRSGADTGSVAINTAPKANEPMHKCQMGDNSKKAMVVSVATQLNMAAMVTVPRMQPIIIRQLPTPVPIRMAAPTIQANTDVSPMLPGISPTNEFHNDTPADSRLRETLSCKGVFAAIPRGVADV